MLYIFGIALAFFLSLLLFTKKGKSAADVILACWLSLIGIHLSGFYFFGISHSPYSILAFPLPLLHGPFLYCYTAFLTNLYAPLKKYWIWHCMPIVMAYALLIPFMLLPYAGKMVVIENKGRDFEIQSLIINTLINLSGIFYFFLSLFLLRMHARFIHDRFSDIGKINLNWLRYLIFGIGIIWIAVLFRNDNIIYALVSLFIIFLGYFGIKQVGIFTQNTPGIHSEEFTDNGTFRKNIESGQKLKAIQPATHKPIHLELHRDLLELIEKEKPFIHPELAIADLAALLKTHPHTLSQVINALESKTFYDYINEKRIGEFKRIALLPENQKFTMLALAYNCGFNSKTAFYRNFKKTTGQSPTEYLTQWHISLS